MYNIVINPASKSGLGIKVWRKIEPVLKEKNIEYQTFMTTDSHNVSEIARKITSSDGEHKIIVLGGDGTLNDILQGIGNFENVVIGYIPAGSSNDLARDLKITSNPLKRLEEILAEKNVVLKDVGELVYNAYDTDSLIKAPEDFKTVRRFSVSAGIGFDAAVSAEVSTSKAKALLNRIKAGKFVYLFIALKQLISARREWCEITIDNNPPERYEKLLFLAAMIHKYEGGGFKFCPNAMYNDGKLDLCMAGKIPKLKILLILPTAFRGRHLKFKDIYEFRGSNIRIKTKKPLWIHTDGEVYAKASDISVCCSKYQIKFIL